MRERYIFTYKDDGILVHDWNGIAQSVLDFLNKKEYSLGVELDENKKNVLEYDFADKIIQEYIYDHGVERKIFALHSSDEWEEYFRHVPDNYDIFIDMESGENYKIGVLRLLGYLDIEKE